MEQKFDRVAPGLYRRQYATANGESSVLYYGRLKRKRDGKSQLFALGPKLQEAKDELSIIKVRNRRGEDLSAYRPKAKSDEGKAKQTTVEAWSKIYLDL